MGQGQTRGYSAQPPMIHLWPHHPSQKENLAAVGTALPHNCPQPWPTTVMSPPCLPLFWGLLSTLSHPFPQPLTW